jgi:hypothetical protein
MEELSAQNRRNQEQLAREKITGELVALHAPLGMET